MQKSAFSLCCVMVLALGAAGCNSSNDPSAAQATTVPAAPQATSVSGQVSLQPGTKARELSRDARMELALVDISKQPSVTVATKVVEPAGQFPIVYQIDFDPARIDAADIYEIRVAITDGERRYTMPLTHPVLTQGKGATADIALFAEPTAAEKMLAEFDDIKASIGGMKVNQGTKLEDNQSHAWQIFRQNGELKFVREIVDYTSGGRTDTDYAYVNGKPFVVVQKHQASSSAPVDSVEEAGWTAGGEAVVKTREAGGSHSTLEAKELDSLYKQAEAMFKRAGGNKY